MRLQPLLQLLQVPVPSPRLPWPLHHPHRHLQQFLLPVRLPAQLLVLQPTHWASPRLLQRLPLRRRRWLASPLRWALRPSLGPPLLCRELPAVLAPSSPSTPAVHLATELSCLCCLNRKPWNAAQSLQTQIEVLMPGSTAPTVPNGNALLNGRYSPYCFNPSAWKRRGTT